MSINKHVDDHNITGIAQVGIRDRFRPCSRDSSGGRTTSFGDPHVMTLLATFLYLTPGVQNLFITDVRKTSYKCTS